MSNVTDAPTTSAGGFTPSNITSGDVGQTWQEARVHVIKLYLFPVVIILSWLNNVTAIVVLLSKAYRHTSTGFLMTSLAISDIGVVSTGMLRLWLIALTSYDIRLASGIACKLHAFFTYVTVNWSAWCLTVISVERTISVCNPLKCRQIASPRRVRIAWSVIVVVISLVYSTLLWAYDVYVPDPDGHRKACRPTEAYMPFWKKGYFQSIDLVMSSLGPFAVILPCNVIITAQIARSRRRRSQISASSGSTRSVSSTTLMLAVTCVLFLVLTAPMAVVLLVLNYDLIANSEYIPLIYTACYILFNINSSINFLLYCASGSKFRHTLAVLCFGRKTRREPTQCRQTLRSTMTSAAKNYVIGTELPKRSTTETESNERTDATKSRV